MKLRLGNQPSDGDHHLEIIARFSDDIQSYFFKIGGVMILHLWRNSAHDTFLWRDYCSNEDTKALEQWFKKRFPSMTWVNDDWVAAITLNEFDQAVLKLEAVHA